MKANSNGYCERKKRGRALRVFLQIGLVSGVFLAALFLLSTACPAWTSGGVVVNSSTHDSTVPRMIPDGSGGTIVAYQRRWSATDVDVWASRVDSSGTNVWNTCLVSDSNTQQNPRIATDGAGGAFVVWEDNRGGNFDVYVRRVAADGSFPTGWSAEGVRLSDATQDETSPQVASDNNGGAFVTWTVNFGAEDTDIYLKRVGGSGSVAGWMTMVDTVNTWVRDPRITTLSGLTECMVTWDDHRSGTDWEIYAQRVDYNGGIKTGWASGGNLVSTYSGHATYDDTSPQITSDGAGGALIAWEVAQSPVAYFPELARVDSAGAVLWNNYTDFSGVTEKNAQLVPDGSNGAIVTWEDNRDGNWDIYAQRMRGTDGAWQWGTNGVKVSSSIHDETLPQIASDGAGGYFITWQESHGAGDTDINEARVNTSGTLLWTGLWVDQTGENDDLNPQIVTAGTGGAVISWQDNRDITDHNWDIYAQNVSGDPHIITATAGPNGTISPSGPVGVVDQTGRLSFDFIPRTGYHEDDILLGGTSVGWGPNQPGIDLSLVPSDSTLYVTFAIDTHTLTTNTVGSGTVGLNPAGGTYDYNTEVTLTATPATGWHFTGWSGDLSGTTNPEHLFMTTNHSATATFAIDTHTVNASVTGGHGTVTEATQTVDYGTSATIHITPEAGYKIASITDNGAAATIANPYVISNVATDHNVVVTFAQDVSASAVWYLAEGSTDWGFDCYISIENPNDTAVNVKLTYMTSSGPKDGPTVKMPAKSQATIYPSATLGAADFSTKVECLDEKLISVDRTMYWTGPGAPCPEAHCATGVTAPATTWYLPEGCSDYGFECYLLIQNPNSTAANCTVTWMIEGETPATSSITVPASSRSNLNMFDEIGAKNASIKVVSDKPVIPERAMYRNDRREGHDSGGTPTPANDYYLAEGCTGFGFTTYVLVQNPQDSETKVTVTYQAKTGPVTGPVFTMPANSRKTICVNTSTPIPGDDPSFSTHVHGSAPIIAERAMYWNGGPDNAEVCHDSIGLDQPYTNWYLADGQSSGGRETFTLVQNPNDSAVKVEVTYMTPDGTGNVVKTETIPANSRMTFNMADHSGISGRAAIMVKCTTAGKNVMCERAMYWNNRGTGTDTIGGYAN